MSEVPFDAWARFYDAALPPDRPDRPFFVDYCRDADGPVLELGCGTGAIYLELLEAGVDAYGIDLSAAMLNVLRRNATERGVEPKVRRADIADFSFDFEFDTVVAPLNVVRHVASLDDQRAAFRNVSDALGDGGRFAFWVDLLDVDDLCDQRSGTTTTERFTCDDRRYDLEIRIELADRIEQTVAYAFSYADVETGDLVATMEFEMALVSKPQFDLLLDEAGFSEWTYHNGPDLTPLSTPSEPVVCLAAK
ncbi:class I SAM-dependent methyltransferase [Haloferacaceae archaeon DSL9]